MNGFGRWQTIGGTVGVIVALAAWACGGGSSGSPTSPSTGGSSGGTPSNPATTFTITAAGVSPKTLTVSPGTRITFVNNDVRSRDIQSDPHPEHTDCPEISQVGFLQPGQTKETGNLNTVRTCGFHDHNDAFNTAVQGSVIIR